MIIINHDQIYHSLTVIRIKRKEATCLSRFTSEKKTEVIFIFTNLSTPEKSNENISLLG